MATGTESASSTMLSVTWPEAWTEPLPGGNPGPSTKMTIGVRISVATSQRMATRRKWGVLSVFCISDDLHVPVHVADGLHRAAEVKDGAGAAGHEALPAVEPLGSGLEREGHRHVRLAHRAGRVRAGVLGVVRNAGERHRDVKLRYREDVRGVIGVDRLHGLAVQRERPPDRAARLRDERVAKP